MGCDRNIVIRLENHNKVSKYGHHGVRFVHLVMKPAVVPVTCLRISSILNIEYHCDETCAV